MCVCVLCNFNAFEVKLLNARHARGERNESPRPASPRLAAPRLRQMIWQVSFVSHGAASAAKSEQLRERAGERARESSEETASHCCPLTPESMQRWAKATKMAADGKQNAKRI